MREAEGIEDDDEFDSEVKNEKKSSSGDQNYQVTGVAWSCNGASLAVAYGKTDHVTWCEHQSILNVWSIFRRDFNPKKPTITLEVPNCLSCIVFHPQNP